MSAIPDAEALYAALREGVKPLLRAETRLVGITSGGAWLVERLHRDLVLPGT
ncbi:MAG: bifunctional pyr operon transcriptional regulator/uracil phosphoribosyltransferase PyrR, partial [Comamonadaceae bacterium]